MIRQCPLFPLVLIALSLATWAGHTSAQQPQGLRGTVTDAGSGASVSAALVAVVGPDGERGASMLTGPDGSYALEVREAGSWRLEVMRLGYRPLETEPVEVEPGGWTGLDVTLEAAPMEMDAVEVAAEARRACRALDPEESGLLMRLWEEARSALTVVAWAEETGRYEFELVRWERVTELYSDRVVGEEQSARTTSVRPFEAAPAAELLDEGWVRSVPDDRQTFEYYGLEARTLVSPVFQDAHCFRVEEPPEGRPWVGIGFDPIRRAGVPGVVGTLWLDRESGSLERLDFHYTVHPHEPPIPPEVTPIFDGRVEYRGLPDGGWVVDRWRLRMPQYAHTVSTGQLRMTGRGYDFGGEFQELLREQPGWWQDRARELRLSVVEQGGELTRIETPDGQVLSGRAWAGVEGVVLDSTRMQVLEGARVTLAGTSHETHTDPGGRYRLEVPQEGRYALQFEHPRLDALGIESLPTVEVELERGETRQITLGTPTERTLQALRCEQETDGGEPGVVWGTVAEASTGEPLPGARVRFVPEREGEPLETQTDADGRYRVCGVPDGVRFGVHAEMMGRTGEPRGLTLAEDAVVELGLALPLGGIGVLRGSVVQGGSEEPIAQARVRIRGRETTLEVTSDAAGQFRVNELPAGSYEVEVSHLAFQDLAEPVWIEVPGAQTTTLTVRLLRDAIALDPVEVTVEANRPTFGPLVDVYDRRDRMEALGLGHIFDREDLDGPGSSSMARMIATRVPGARVVPGSIMFSTIYIHRTNDCEPSYYIDGLLQGAGDMEVSIDFMISPANVEMIEVYRGVAQLPGEFADNNARRCGAIAVWTRRGR